MWPVPYFSLFACPWLAVAHWCLSWELATDCARISCIWRCALGERTWKSGESQVSVTHMKQLGFSQHRAEPASYEGSASLSSFQGRPLWSSCSGSQTGSSASHCGLVVSLMGCTNPGSAVLSLARLVSLTSQAHRSLGGMGTGKTRKKGKSTSRILQMRNRPCGKVAL